MYEHYWLQRQLITACIITPEKCLIIFRCTLLHSANLIVCAQAYKMKAGKEPAKIWFHWLMPFVVAEQMVFLDS